MTARNYPSAAQRYDQLVAATFPLELDETDRRFLSWLAGWDIDTCNRATHLFNRLRTT